MQSPWMCDSHQTQESIRPEPPPGDPQELRTVSEIHSPGGCFPRAHGPCLECSSAPCLRCGVLRGKARTGTAAQEGPAFRMLIDRSPEKHRVSDAALSLESPHPRPSSRGEVSQARMTPGNRLEWFSELFLRKERPFALAGVAQRPEPQPEPRGSGFDCLSRAPA